MNCVICKTGQAHPGKTTLTLQRGETIIVIKEVPAKVCENCGEYYLDQSVSGSVYQQAEEAVRRNTEVEILRYAA